MKGKEWLIVASTVAFFISACEKPDWLNLNRNGADSANIKFPTAGVIFNIPTSTMYQVRETYTPLPTMPSAGDAMRTQRANHLAGTATAQVRQTEAAQTPTPQQ